MKRRVGSPALELALLKYSLNAPKAETLNDRVIREGACKLRDKLTSALHLAAEINDPLQGSAELAMNTIEGLLRLALQNLDSVEDFRDRGDSPIEFELIPDPHDQTTKESSTGDVSR